MVVKRIRSDTTTAIAARWEQLQTKLQIKDNYKRSQYHQKKWVITATSSFKTIIRNRHRCIWVCFCLLILCYDRRESNNNGNRHYVTTSFMIQPTFFQYHISYNRKHSVMDDRIRRNDYQYQLLQLALRDDDILNNYYQQILQYSGNDDYNEDSVDIGVSSQGARDEMKQQKAMRNQKDWSSMTTKINNDGNDLDLDFDLDDDVDDYYNYKQQRRRTNDIPITTEEDEEFEEDYYHETEYETPNSTNLYNDVNGIEWEKCRTRDCGTVYVLLPPISVLKPTCIVHFIGGTVVGSAPNIWYKRILQDIVLHTNCCIIVSTIPIISPIMNPLNIKQQQSPLHHVQLSKQILEQFRVAYTTVIMDEYDYKSTLQSLPICGIGHSLGARLLTVLTTSTLGKIPMQAKGTRDNTWNQQQQQQQIPKYLSYQAMILISFSNYGAAAGIPGIASLFRTSRKLENRQNRRSRNGMDIRENRNKRGRKRKDMSTNDGWWDDDNFDIDDEFDDDDVDLYDLFNEITDVVEAGTTRIQSMFTPSTKLLEFIPSPKQLWDAIQTDARYTVNQTLIIQFDDDTIDQSSKLATSITNSSDVYFARIRGNHLVPIISVGSDTEGGRRSYDSRDESSFLKQMNHKLGRMLKAVQGKNQRNEELYIELRQSLVRYIIDVVSQQRS